GGPHPLTSLSPASNDSPTAPRHTASSHYTWPTVTPRIDPRAELRHSCAPRPPTHSRCLNWHRLRDQNWPSFFDRYQLAFSCTGLGTFFAEKDLWESKRSCQGRNNHVETKGNFNSRTWGAAGAT